MGTRLIDANELMTRICEHECGSHPEDCDGMESKTVPCNFHAYVSEAPTVDAVPRDYMECEIKYINQKYNQQIKALAEERDAYISRYNELLQKMTERVQIEPLKLELKVPVKRGKWETPPNEIFESCNICRYRNYDPVYTPNFCPNCGADMR